MPEYFYKAEDDAVVHVVADRIVDADDQRHFVRRGEVIRSVPAGTDIRHIVVTENLHPQGRLA
ncbi:hypothetical protein ACFYUV_04065 [Nonomuraea sp. NPDC003560]|uniref:hypothetical protein n=1 Tax=Nonomuraea sp. NPDC003560 TaxID=3364341 RepID=UPI0036AB25CC